MHIFIGGTGRVGSSLLRSLLLKHKDICGNNFEGRFTVSPDGIFEFLKNSHNTQNLYLIYQGITNGISKRKKCISSVSKT